MPGVALVEWQFPTTASEVLVVPAAQVALAADSRLGAAFYPQLSDENATETPHMLEKLEAHAVLTYQAFVAGRRAFAPPWLLNISVALPAALDRLISGEASGEAVRIIAFSTGSVSRLAGLDAVLAAHPEVLLVAATPHISGNRISVEALAERPSILALQPAPHAFSNVLLAGGLVAPDAADGEPGTAAHPFIIDNQPTPASAPQVFMLDCRSAAAFAPGVGGTSAAAPHLASLVAILWERRAARGEATTVPALLAALAEVTKAGLAREKTGEVRPVRYFTLAMILALAGGG